MSGPAVLYGNYLEMAYLRKDKKFWICYYIPICNIFHLDEVKNHDLR